MLSASSKDGLVPPFEWPWIYAKAFSRIILKVLSSYKLPTNLILESLLKLVFRKSSF